MDKYRLHENASDADMESFPSVFTPLSIYVEREKKSRATYVNESKVQKCLKCKVRWQVPSVKQKHGLYGQNDGLCKACDRKRKLAMMPDNIKSAAPKEPVLLSYISNKYPAWIISAEKREPGDSSNSDKMTFFRALKNRENLDVIKYMCFRLPRTIFSLRDENNMLPLSVAILSQCSGEVILFLLEHNKSAVLDLAQNKYLPALFAMIVGPKIRLHTVEVLVKSTDSRTLRSALYKLDKEGMTFLSHYVKLPHADRSQLKLLIRTAGQKVLYVNDLKQWMPIHHACTHPNVAVIETLVHTDPEQLLMEDGTNGMLPLQYFIKHSSNFDYLSRECCYQALTERKQYREKSLKHLDKFGRTAMHIAISYNAPIDLIDSLLETNLIDLLQQDIYGKTCLHLAVQKPSLGIRLVEMLIRKCSKSIGLTECNGWTAMRYFLHHGSNDVIETTYKDPNSKSKSATSDFHRNDRDWTESERYSILKQLLMRDIHTKCATAKDPFCNDEIPLHYLLRTKRMPNRHALLLISYGGLRITDTLGRMALHIAVSHNADYKVTEAILDSCVDASSALTKNKLLPVEIALRKNNDRSIIKLIMSGYIGNRAAVSTLTKAELEYSLNRMIDMFPERLYVSLNQLDVLNRHDLKRVKSIVSSRTPLHYAAMSNQPVEIIEYLVDRFSGATEVRDDSGKLPAHYYLLHDNVNALSYLLSIYFGSDDLIEKCPLEVVRNALKYPCPLFHDAIKQSIVHRLCWNDNHAHILRLISHYRPKLLLEKDNENRTPIDVAIENNALASKHAILEELIQKSYINISKYEESYIPVAEGDSSEIDCCPIVLNEGEDMGEESDIESCFRAIVMGIKLNIGQLMPNVEYSNSTETLRRLSVSEILRQKPKLRVISSILSFFRDSNILPADIPGLPLIIPTKWASYRSTKAVLSAALSFKNNGFTKTGPQGHFHLYFLCEAPFMENNLFHSCARHPKPPHEKIVIVRPGGWIFDIVAPVLFTIYVLKLATSDFPQCIPHEIEELNGTLLDNLMFEYLEKYYLDCLWDEEEKTLANFQAIINVESIRTGYSSIHKYMLRKSDGSFPLKSLTLKMNVRSQDGVPCFSCGIHSLLHDQTDGLPVDQSSENCSDLQQDKTTIRACSTEESVGELKKSSTLTGPRRASRICIIQ
eukprot:g13372.t1